MKIVEIAVFLQCILLQGLILAFPAYLHRRQARSTNPRSRIGAGPGARLPQANNFGGYPPMPQQQAALLDYYNPEEQVQENRYMSASDWLEAIMRARERLQQQQQQQQQQQLNNGDDDYSSDYAYDTGDWGSFQDTYPLDMPSQYEVDDFQEQKRLGARRYNPLPEMIPEVDDSVDFYNAYAIAARPEDAPVPVPVLKEKKSESVKEESKVPPSSTSTDSPVTSSTVPPSTSSPVKESPVVFHRGQKEYPLYRPPSSVDNQQQEHLKAFQRSAQQSPLDWLEEQLSHLKSNDA